MHPDDVAVRDGFPVTSIPRTLLDLAGMLTPAEVERALEQAIRMQALDFRKLAELLDRSRARRGTKALRAIIAAHAPQSVYTRQELERRFWAFIVKLRFPRPQLNVWVAGYEVDAYWPEYGLIAELDGYETHGGLQAFENDHVKTAKLQLAGYTVVRVTWRMLHDDPGGVAALLQAHFARQAAAGARR